MDKLKEIKSNAVDILNYREDHKKNLTHYHHCYMSYMHNVLITLVDIAESLRTINKR